MSFESRGGLKKQGVSSTKPAQAVVTPVTPRPLPEKAFRRRKSGRYSVKKSVLSERSEFTDFRIPPGFSAFGGSGPRLFVTFGAMPKVKPLHRAFH